MLWRVAFSVALLGLALAVLTPPSHAFHSGGCKNCHTMHNSQDGVPVVLGATSPALLKHATSTDLCLTCHADNAGAVLGFDPLSPPPEKGGGNFTFLQEDNINDGPGGATAPIVGDHAGHNVVGNGHGLASDPDYTVAPGGSYPSSELTCTSCHDPHLRGTYRLLRSTGPTPNGFLFTYPAPEALGIPLSAGPESPARHTAYRAGWSDWCANCHGLYHEDTGQGGFEHPADHSMGGAEMFSYNGYNGPSDPYGGSYATAYLPEVPIQDSNRTPTSTAGAIGSSRVTCMSCHRAHATSAPASTRWDPNVQFLPTDGTVSGSYPIPSPFNDPDQRALCVKCHYDDAQDHGFGTPCMDCHRYPLARFPRPQSVN